MTKVIFTGKTDEPSQSSAWPRKIYRLLLHKSRIGLSQWDSKVLA